MTGCSKERVFVYRNCGILGMPSDGCVYLSPDRDFTRSGLNASIYEDTASIRYVDVTAGCCGRLGRTAGVIASSGLSSGPWLSLAYRIMPTALHDPVCLSHGGACSCGASTERLNSTWIPGYHSGWRRILCSSTPWVDC